MLAQRKARNPFDCVNAKQRRFVTSIVAGLDVVLDQRELEQRQSLSGKEIALLTHRLVYLRWLLYIVGGQVVQV